MLKTVLKIDGMMCGMCESHMNDLIRKHCKVKKVSSSAKKGETVVISEEALDIPMLEKEIKEIGYELVSHTSEPFMRKKDCSVDKNYSILSPITVCSVCSVIGVFLLIKDR